MRTAPDPDAPGAPPRPSRTRRILRRAVRIGQITAFWLPPALAAACLALKVRGFAWYLHACRPKGDSSDIFLVSDCGRYLNMLPDAGLLLAFGAMAAVLLLLCVLRRWRSAGRMLALLGLAAGINAALGAWFDLQLT